MAFNFGYFSFLKHGSMKKLFTLCASALLAFTLSAQAETSEGTYYLSTGDCTQFVKDGGISFDNLSLGYAVNDDVVIMATVNNLGQEDAEEILLITLLILECVTS